MQVCTKCVLPETFPGIHFDDDGVCNHCKQFESFTATDEQRVQYQNKLMTMVDTYKDRPTQVLMAYSGGKDSTYTMWLMKEKYGADVIAFTFDNGFISDQAYTNINNVCSALDIEHVIVQYEQEMLNELFRHASTTEGSMYPMKTMERASSICTICSGFFKAAAMKMAIEQKIPMIGYGWSPGQAPIQSALTQANPRFVKMAQANACKPITNVIGDSAEEYFLQPEHYGIEDHEWPWSVHPLAFEAYDEEEIKQFIQTLGWVNPTDVDTNSTNCTMNAFANQVHIDKFGFHPYVQEIANMVRQGTMSREEGMEKIYTDQNPTLVNFALQSIELKVE